MFNSNRLIQDHAHRDATNAREIEVWVQGGYFPDMIYSKVGEPLRILFRREESSACSEQVVFPAFGKSATLPEGQQVAVELHPSEPGTYGFTCAMGILRGWLVVFEVGQYPALTTIAAAKALIRSDLR